MVEMFFGYRAKLGPDHMGTMNGEMVNWLRGVLQNSEEIPRGI